MNRGAEPSFLRKNKDQLRKELVAARNAEAQASTDAEKLAAKRQREACEKKYNRPSVKERLSSAFHGKCAYCESLVRHVAYPHIEHFEPKDQRPDLAFEWSNLLLACGICNGPTWKGTKSPARASGGPVLDPCADAPEDHLQFQYDSRTKMASIGWRTARGKATLGFFGLNSSERQDLMAHRSQRIAEILTIARLAATDPAAEELWRDATSGATLGSREYSAWIRAEMRGDLETL